jgi:acetyltransferase-like isoleucine patch superfamily enzyme
VGCNVKITGFEMIDIGDNVEIKDNVTISTGRPRPRELEKRCFFDLTDYNAFEKGRIVIGDYSRLSFGALIIGYGGVKIGKKCAVGIGAKVISETNHYKGREVDRMYKPSGSAPQEEQSILRGKIVLEDGATLAANAIAFPGAVIGKDSWVAANSVVRVMGRIPPNKIAKGNSAEVWVDRNPKS